MTFIPPIKRALTVQKARYRDEREKSNKKKVKEVENKSNERKFE